MGTHLGGNKEEAYIYWLEDRRLEVFGLGIDRLILICISCIKLVSTNSTQSKKSKFMS